MRLVLAGLLFAGCTPAKVSDTGYVGTWRRGNERVQSEISIVEREGEYLFRWRVTSADGKWYVRCDWDGRCREFVDGEKTSEYAFRTWVDGEAGKLRVECKGRFFKPEEKDLHFVDELHVKRQGLAIRAWTIEQAGERFELGQGPSRLYFKVSDRVDDAPPGAGPTG